MEQRPKHVLYIAGSGRSGSTLVERTLGAIPGWVNVGELIELFRKPSVAGELCGCGEPFESCVFWSEVGRLAFGSWSSETISRIGALQRQLSRQRYLPRLLLTGDDSDSAFADTLREYGALYDTLYNAIATVADADVVVDASKWPGQALALQRVISADMSLLHLVRDPRGVAFSWAKTSVARPQGGDSGSVMATHKTRDTAGRWAAFQSEIALIRPVFEHSARLRYEDFVTTRTGRLTATLESLGLGDYLDSDSLNHVHRDALDLPQSHGVAGNPSRFEHGVVRLRNDDAWREKLPAGDRRLVTSVTAPLLLRYGYPLQPSTEPAPAVVDAAEVTDWPQVCVITPTRGRPSSYARLSCPLSSRTTRATSRSSSSTTRRSRRPSSRSSSAPAARSRCSTTRTPRVWRGRATPASTTPRPPTSPRATTTTSGTPTSCGSR